VAPARHRHARHVERAAIFLKNAGETAHKPGRGGCVERPPSRMRARLLIAIGCLWTACGPARSVDRVVNRPLPPGTERPPASSPDPEGPPASAVDAAPDGSDASAQPNLGATTPDAGSGPPDGRIDAAVPPPDRPPAAPDAAAPAPDTRPDLPRPPPPDTSPPPADRLPDTAPACPPEPAADRIADFEGGALETLQVGARGGTPWTVISTPAGITGTIAAVEVRGPCGSQGAMRLAGTSDGTRAPIVRALLLAEEPAARFLDATGYRGIRLWLRAVPAGRVRIKIGDGNTTRAGGVCTGCNNHFLRQIDVDGQLRPYVVLFAEMKQEASEEIQPALDRSALFSLEIVPPKLATHELVIDDVSFVK
jgi:hypothetical protein